MGHKKKKDDGISTMLDKLSSEQSQFVVDTDKKRNSILPPFYNKIMLKQK